MDWLSQIFDPATIGAFFTQFRNEMAEPTFWIAVGKIIWIKQDPSTNPYACQASRVYSSLYGPAGYTTKIAPGCVHV